MKSASGMWCGVGRIVGLIGLVVLFVVVGATSAFGAEGAPIAIKSFALQTTRTQASTESLSHENWGFVNEPVSFVQAGGHPNGQLGGADALTASMEFENQEVNTGGEGLQPAPTRDPRDIVVDLPTGLLGNPTALPRCPLKMALNGEEACPAATQVGEAVLYLQEGEGLAGPIINVVPEAGQSAEFAIDTAHDINFILTAHVIRTKMQTNEGVKESYGLTVVTNSIPVQGIYKVETSFWGVPASPSHDPERGRLCTRVRNDPWTCRGPERNKTVKAATGEASGAPEVPFLTMPSDCAGGPQTAVMRADSWEEPGRVGVNGAYEGYVEARSVMPGVTGCDLLSFEPGVGVEPDSLLADAPVGLGVNLSVPQVEKPDVPAVPEMRKATITLPAGVSVSPGVVDGIRACNESGPEGINFEGPESEEVGANGEWQLAPGHCPDASTVGSAEAVTPLLSEPIKGHVYLARPGCGGAGQAACTERDAVDGNLYQLYLELGGTGPLADTGVNIKVRLKTEANPATGQLTTVSEEIAQLPFSDLKVVLNGGPRAPLDNPAVCGPATASADFTPWAAPGRTPEGVLMPGLGDVTPVSAFDVNGCGGSPGLAPGFVAGTVSPLAGRFSAFTVNLSRNDREQYVKGIQVHTPPGLLGVLSSVPLCGEADADAGSCPEASRIGSTRVASGAGSHPFEIEGDVYLTSSYRGAPFGLSVVTDAVAGPFNLGKVVVRARINVDPRTSALTVTTDEDGPYALPQILDGVPLRLKRILVNIDRPGFMFNPTSCKGQRITASVSGSAGTVATEASPFSAGDCRSLAFAPKFSVSTSGHTSRRAGASLDAKLSYPKGAMGRDANIARVKVSLPRQLPSYLPTLQKACLAGTFESDPAECPAGSIVGIARASTPLLAVGLTGPVYFVSHGGEEFPSLIVVLQGDGVRVDLTGGTFIKKGITSSTFKTVPDVPVNSFELYLPESKGHALAANGNLCKQVKKLVMPTEFVAQNGAVIKQNTKIGVTGCAKKKIKHDRSHHRGKASASAGGSGKAHASRRGAR